MTSEDAPKARGWQPTLPGLSLPSSGVTDLERAALASMEALDADGVLEPRHALTVQLVLELSRVIGAGVRTGKTAAVAMAAKQLLEAIESLPTPAPDPGDKDPWAELERRLAEAAREGGVAP